MSGLSPCSAHQPPTPRLKSWCRHFQTSSFLHAHTYTHTHTHTHTRKHAHARAHTHTHTTFWKKHFISSSCINLLLKLVILLNVCLCLCLYVCVCVCVCVHLYVCVCLHMMKPCFLQIGNECTPCSGLS